MIVRDRTYFSLVTTDEILEGLERVLHYPHLQQRHKLDANGIRMYIRTLRETSEVLDTIVDEVHLSRDPDDDKFLACAVAGRADYLVSGDQHLLEIGPYKGVRVLTPTTSLALLKPPDSDR